MSSNTIFARYFSTVQQIAVFSILFGLVSALLFGGMTSLTLHSKREAGYDLLTQDFHHYLTTFFQEIHSTANGIQPLTMDECRQTSGELTSRAAFSLNVRAFVLVRHGDAYCSSATGSMNMEMSDLDPDIDLNKNIDLSIMTGTPMMPGKPTITVWFKNPLADDRGVFATLNVNLTPYFLFTTRQSDISSMAIVIGDKALSTLSSEVVGINELPPTRLAPPQWMTIPSNCISTARHGPLRIFSYRYWRD